MLTFCLKRSSQDYHNLRVTAFNRNVEELGKRTADLVESQSKSPLFFCGGVLAHPRAVVPEIRASC